MFTLWYSILSWKEYRDVILDKLSKQPLGKEEKGEKVAPKAPVVAPKPAPAPVPTIPVPTPPPKSQLPPKLDPPAKPPRSPSPHPLRSEAFDDDDIEYEDEETEEDDDEEENSVIDSLPVKKPTVVTNSVNDFINFEIKNQQQSHSIQR